MIRRPTAKRREEIADAALRIIGTRGISSLTIVTLAAELGLTGGALYRHFPSTDAILEAVAARAEELLDASVPPDEIPPIEWLERFAQSRTEALGGHVGLAGLMLSEQLAFALPPAALERLRGVVRRSRTAIVRVLSEGQARGVVRRDLPAEALAPVVIGTLQMIAMHRGKPLLPRVPGDPMELFRTLKVLLSPPSPQRGGYR
jgi:AcrR family transcriptional regulator